MNQGDEIYEERRKAQRPMRWRMWFALVAGLIGFAVIALSAQQFPGGLTPW